MRIRPTGHPFVRLPYLVAPVFFLAAHQALAGSCLLPPAKLSDSAINAFKANPSELLERFATGGPGMSAEIMRRAATDTGVLPEIIELARKGSIAQRVAIGIGLAKASSACARNQPELEQTIKKAVADSGISELATAFAAGLSSLDFVAAPFAGSAPSAGAAITSGPAASAGGGSRTATSFRGGPVVTGTEFLTSNVPFSSRGLTSTFGNTISPTRR